MHAIGSHDQRGGSLAAVLETQLRGRQASARARGLNGAEIVAPSYVQVRGEERLEPAAVGTELESAAAGRGRRGELGGGEDVSFGVVDGRLLAETGEGSGQVGCERSAGVRTEGYAVIVPSPGGWRRGLLVDGAQDAAPEEVAGERQATDAGADDGDWGIGAHGDARPLLPNLIVGG